MFALRDQENLVNAHQTAAAAKPLNQGVGGLAPKTPSNNAPKSNLNGRTGFRTNGKGDENVFIGGGKTGAGKNAFVTPAPKDRAPLGAKTTNAKAQAFQTPAPLAGDNVAQKTQHRSVSARKSKLKVHQQVEPPVAGPESDGEEPDIEYAPPKIKELPDWPDEDALFVPGRQFPQFEGNNYSRDWYQIYCNPVGEDGLTRSEREAQKLDKDIEEMMERHTEALRKQCLQEAGIEESTESNGAPEKKLSKPVAIGPQRTTSTTSKVLATRTGPSTLSSRSAASALSNTSPRDAKLPNFAAPTAAAKAKSTLAAPSALVNAPNRRNTPGTVASNTTIGYSKGRKVSSSLRQIPGAPNAGSKKVQANKENDDVDPEDELLRNLLKSTTPSENEEEDHVENFFKDRFGGKDWFDEQAEKEFVLKMPEQPSTS